MSDKLPTNTIDTGPGGTLMVDGIDQILSEIATIYGHLNAICALQTGATAPGSPAAGELWVDTSTGQPILRRWNSAGSSWDQLGESGGFDTAVTLDDGLTGYTKDMLLVRASATSLKIVAPATIMINGALLQIETDYTLTGMSSASGDYDIYAERSGSTSVFTLGFAAHPYSAPTSRRIVGRAVRAASDFTSIRSTEFPVIADDLTDLETDITTAYEAADVVAVAAATAAAITPSGVISAFGGAPAPSGWLLCDGSSVLRATYSALFAVIGTTFGSADGTHFNVPDLRANVPVGYKASDANFGTLGGAAGADHQHLPAHTHTFDKTQATNALYNAAGIAILSTIADTAGTTSSTGDGTDPISVLQPSLTVNFIIKT